MAVAVDPLVDHGLPSGQPLETQPLNFTPQVVFLLQDADCCAILRTDRAVEVKWFQPAPDPRRIPRRLRDVEKSVKEMPSNLADAISAVTIP